MNNITDKNFRRLIAIIIDDLPQDEKLILSMYYTDGLSLQEISNVLSLSLLETTRKYVRAQAKCLAPKHSLSLNRR